jgi:hypothetical protein
VCVPGREVRKNAPWWVGKDGSLRSVTMFRWWDPGPVAEDGLENEHLELSKTIVEVLAKGLYIVLGTTLPPHLYLRPE